jgi:uncharacterized RDD family membrane protein YckC
MGGHSSRAGFWARLGAYIADSVLFGVVFFVLALVLGALVDDEDAAGNIIVLFALVFPLVYYIGLEGGPTGQTFGKKLLGIRVVDARTGGAVGYGRATIRFISRILSSLPLYLGYLWMLWDREKQTWHDKLAGTYVVRAETAAITPSEEEPSAVRQGPFERA